LKILYIDNKLYSHNKDIHVNFFSYINEKGLHQIIPYGKYLNKCFDKAIMPGKNPNKELKSLVEKTKPDCIITYNSNGSSYEVKMDNVHYYEWCQDFLGNTNVPKFHFTTDYCRSGFKQEQADWFKNLNYAAAFFRHKVSLQHPIQVPAFWIPFSVNKELYEKNSISDLNLKEIKVGFIGAAHNSSKELYSNRIAAIDLLLKNKKLNLTKVIDEKKFERLTLQGSEYVKFLTKNLFNLTCGGTCQFMTAKYFQIPAARSFLICTPTVGLEDFPENTYILYTKDNVNELIHQINYYEKNLKEAKFKIETLNKHVIENHSHLRRIDEMTKIIKNII
jgi:hypothetical protein